MLVLYILGGLIGLLLLLLCIPVLFRIHYDGELTVSLRVLGVRVALYPTSADEQAKQTPKKRKKSQKADEKDGSKEASTWSELSAALKENGVSAAVSWLRDVASIVAKAMRRLTRAVTVSRLWLRLEIAGEDAADTALTYGKTCAGLYPALGIIESLLRIRRQEVVVAPAFLQEDSRVFMDIRGRICPLRVVGAAIAAIVSFLISTLTMTKAEKAITKEAINNG